jgi:hypothetical protein
VAWSQLKRYREENSPQVGQAQMLRILEANEMYTGGKGEGRLGQCTGLL